MFLAETEGQEAKSGHLFIASCSAKATRPASNRDMHSPSRCGAINGTVAITPNKIYPTAMGMFIATVNEETTRSAGRHFLVVLAGGRVYCDFIKEADGPDVGWPKKERKYETTEVSWIPRNASCR